MSEVAVSKDALVKVKTALRDYQTDLSSFTAKMKRQSSAISESAEFEILKIDKQIEGTENEIDLIKAQIDFLDDEIKKRTHEKKSSEKEAAALKTKIADLERYDKPTLKSKIKAMLGGMMYRSNESLTQPVRAGAQATTIIASTMRDIVRGSPGPPPDENTGRILQTFIDAVLNPIVQRLRSARQRRQEQSQQSSHSTDDNARELEQDISDGANEAQAKFQAEINQLRSQLSPVESKVERLQNEIDEARTEKEKMEERQKEEKVYLRKLEDKRGRLKRAQAKLKKNMLEMLTAAESFEARAVSETEKSVGGIDRCIAAIDAYLA